MEITAGASLLSSWNTFTKTRASGRSMWQAHPEVEGIEIFPFRVPHQVADISLGLRIDYQGKRLLYSGDSGWTDLFLDQALGADLFICECCFFDRDTPNHMSYETIKKNLPRLRCKNLVLTHMGQEMLARKSELTVTTAEDGMIVEI
jgi:ribonuclease BN (tRNA processing enzyme)